MLISSDKSMIQPFLEDLNDAKEIEDIGRIFSKLNSGYFGVVLFSSTFQYFFGTLCNDYNLYG